MIINDDINQITQDQTFIAREIALGHMTPEQAKTDRRRNVLLQCVGASEKVYPDVFYLKSDINTVYMLCSDGFRHEIAQEEIYTKLKPESLISNNIMTQNSKDLIELNKERMERDNISVVLIRTF